MIIINVSTGHWNSEGLGCLPDTTVPAVYTALQSLPACAAVKSKLKFFEGHTHCNYVPEVNNGFMIGGCGMSDTSCDPIFGFNVIDTTGDKVTVYYFNVNEETSGKNKVDNYAAILNCIQTKGVSGCYDLAQVWASQTLPL